MKVYSGKCERGPSIKTKHLTQRSKVPKYELLQTVSGEWSDSPKDRRVSAENDVFKTSFGRYA